MPKWGPQPTQPSQFLRHLASLLELSAMRSKMRRGSMGMLLLLVVGFCCTPPAAQAEPVVPEVRLESARGVSLGTGMRASAVSSQAHVDNPSNLSMGGVAHLESFTGYQPQLERVGAGLSVVDSMTSKVAAGISARGLFGDNDAGDNSGWEGRISLGVPIIQMLSIGTSLRYANFTVSDPKARPERPVEEGMPADHDYKLKAFTMDAAATLHLFEGFSIAGLAYNLVKTDSPLAPLTVGGGVAFSKDMVSLGGDVLVDLNQHGQFSGPKPIFGGGIELLVQLVAPLRLGYQYDTGRHQHAITAGVGYVDQRFGALLSMRQLIGDYKDTMLFSALQYFIKQ
jgi:hypothetical protein